VIDSTDLTFNEYRREVYLTLEQYGEEELPDLIVIELVIDVMIHT